MNAWIFIAADLVAITVMTFGMYLRRHRRRDLVVSYLAINVGVLAVATALSVSGAGVGLGLGHLRAGNVGVGGEGGHPFF